MQLAIKNILTVLPIALIISASSAFASADAMGTAASKQRAKAPSDPTQAIVEGDEGGVEPGSTVGGGNIAVQEYELEIPLTLQQMNFTGEGKNPQALKLQREVPRFDPRLGTLVEVKLELVHEGQLHYKYESMKDEGLPHLVLIDKAQDQLALTIPGTTTDLVTSTGAWPKVLELAPPSDHQVDLSDVALMGRVSFIQEPVNITSSDPGVLQHFTGQGKAKLDLEANSNFDVQARVNKYIYTAHVRTGVSLRVSYLFTPKDR